MPSQQFKFQLLIFSFIFIIVQSSMAQKPKEYFNSKINQHSISIDFASISYTYVHQFAPKLRLGARIQAGMAVRFIPLLPPKFDPALIDLINFQLLYRAKAAKSFYFDVGLEATYITFFGDMEDQMEMTFGLCGSAYYNFKKFHMGFSLHLRGVESTSFNYNLEGEHVSTTNRKYVLPVFSPLIIGISF